MHVRRSSRRLLALAGATLLFGPVASADALPGDFRLVLPNTPVQNASPTWDIGSASWSNSFWNGAMTYWHNGFPSNVAAYSVRPDTHAVVFLHKGKVVYESYNAGWFRGRPHEAWSVTKKVTDALVWKAMSEGKFNAYLTGNTPDGVPVMSLPDKDKFEHVQVKEVLPDDLGNPARWGDVTVGELLRLKSGMLKDDADVGARDPFLPIIGGQNRNDFLRNFERKGTRGNGPYNNVDHLVLSWILETVYEKSFAAILEEGVWKPAGMEHDTSILTDRAEKALPSMGLQPVARDLARFGRLIAQIGVGGPGNKQILSPAWVRSRDVLDADLNRTFTADGAGGQLLTVSKASCLVGVRFGYTPIGAPERWKSLFARFDKKYNC